MFGYVVADVLGQVSILFGSDIGASVRMCRRDVEHVALHVVVAWSWVVFRQKGRSREGVDRHVQVQQGH